MVGVLPKLPVELALLGGAFDAARRGLVDIDMGDFVIADVFLDVEGNSCEADSLACQPTYALELEYWVNIVRETLVLHFLLAVHPVDIS